MKNSFSDRKKQKLYREWVENSGLPPDSVPEQSTDEPVEADESTQSHRWLDRKAGVVFHVTMRHLLYLVLTIVGLLITTVSLATILIMRSC